MPRRRSSHWSRAATSASSPPWCRRTAARDATPAAVPENHRLLPLQIAIPCRSHQSRAGTARSARPRPKWSPGDRPEGHSCAAAHRCRRSSPCIRAAVPRRAPAPPLHAAHSPRRRHLAPPTPSSHGRKKPRRHLPWRRAALPTPPPSAAVRGRRGEGATGGGGRGPRLARRGGRRVSICPDSVVRVQSVLNYFLPLSFSSSIEYMATYSEHSMKSQVSLFMLRLIHH